MQETNPVQTALEPSTIEELKNAARIAAGHAHVPHSHFHVGAAVLDEEGQIFRGCNVENSSFGLTMCAERNAVGAAVCAGSNRLRAVAIYTSTPTLTPPCGACRQVLIEFGRAIEVHLFNDEHQHAVFTIDQLLPAGFSFSNDEHEDHTPASS